MADINNKPAMGVASTLVEGTADAMDNIFDVYIQWPWEESFDPDIAVSYRCKGFQPPESETPTHKVAWHGVEAEKYSSGVKMDRKMDVEFRLDATFALYNKFVAWAKIGHDVNTSGVANTGAYGKFAFVTPGSEFNAQASWNAPGDGQKLMLTDAMQGQSFLYWNYDSVFVTKVSTPKYDNKAEGKEQYFKVSFKFGDVGAPFFTPGNGSK